MSKKDRIIPQHILQIKVNKLGRDKISPSYNQFKKKHPEYYL